MTTAQENWKMDPKTNCWIWEGAKTKSMGGTEYGRMWNPVEGKNQRAHRVIFETERHKIPKGLTLDHLCRNTLCVNPNHMEVVSLKENILRGTGPTAINARKTHCKRGHALSGGNVDRDVQNGRPRRKCSTCRRMMENKRYARKVALV